MAEMAMQVGLSPLLGVIFDKLSTPILKQFSFICDANGEIEKLSSALTSIRAVVQDAEKKHISDTATQDWLRKLKAAAFEARDIIDECITEGLSFAKSGGSIQVGLSWNPILRYSIAKRIGKVTAKFNSIAVERNNFHFRERVPESAVGELMSQRETSSFVREPIVYGRDEDKENLVNILLSNANSEDNLRVCSIRGHGGIGKTTLAQVVYNEERIAETFYSRIWVCVSEDFNIKRLIKMVIASLSGAECGLLDLDPLQNRLKELLSEKKFLLVLDDVFNENPDLWESFRCSLTCGANGSSILVTTQLPTVETIMGSRDRYDLKPLTNEFCWDLFKARAFGMESENESLEAIGKQIVQKCRGVPLVAKTLGGTLRFERDVFKWESVRDSEIWELKEDEDGILSSLRVSYNRLPLHMRQCFVYCSMYPKDYEIYVEELIQLWMANEFLQPDGEVELEDVGNQIFNQLTMRSFLQVESNDDGKLICKMHHLMHDLACIVSEAECYACDPRYDMHRIPKTVRHLQITEYPSVLPTNFVQRLSKSHPLLHTFLYDGLPDPQIEIVFKNLTCLRVFGSHHVPDLPKSIKKLKHLRFLYLFCYQSDQLPESICSLRNLQTLRLSHSVFLQKLPISIDKLINLRYLDLSVCSGLQFVNGIENLVNLRYLYLSNCFSLGQLPDGIGRLVNIRHLDLSGCLGLIRLPNGIGGLDNLRHLDLSDCLNLIELPNRIGELVNLRHLNLRDCRHLIKLPNGIGGLFNLRLLNLKDCRKLKALPVGVRELIDLRELILPEHLCSSEE